MPIGLTFSLAIEWLFPHAAGIRIVEADGESAALRLAELAGSATALTNLKALDVDGYFDFDVLCFTAESVAPPPLLRHLRSFGFNFPRLPGRWWAQIETFSMFYATSEVPVGPVLLDYSSATSLKQLAVHANPTMETSILINSNALRSVEVWSACADDCPADPQPQFWQHLFGQNGWNGSRAMDAGVLRNLTRICVYNFERIPFDFSTVSWLPLQHLVVNPCSHPVNGLEIAKMTTLEKLMLGYLSENSYSGDDLFTALHSA